MSKRDDLFAAVYAEPDSGEPRIVLADYLMQEGDPLGDFIAKQLAGDDVGADALLAAHGRAWLDSLRPFTSRVQFRRGFPARLELGAITPDAIDVDALAADPALATVEDLLIGQAHHDVYARLIASPAMTALRRVELTHPDVFVALRDSPAKIVHVAYAFRSNQGGHSREWLSAALTACARRGQITSLAFDGSLNTVLESAIAPRLTAIEIADAFSTAQTLELVRQRHLRVTFSPSPALEPCIAGPDKALGAIEIALHDDRIIARAWGEWAHNILHLAVLSQSDERVRIELHGNYASSGRFERAARKFDVELVRVAERPRYGYVDVEGPG